MVLNKRGRGRPKIVAERILKVMDSSKSWTPKDIRNALIDRGWTHPFASIMHGLEELESNYLVGKFGREFFLLDNINRQGMVDAVRLEILEGMSTMTEKEQSAVWTFWLKGLELPYNVMQRILKEREAKNAKK